MEVGDLGAVISLIELLMCADLGGLVELLKFGYLSEVRLFLGIGYVGGFE